MIDRKACTCIHIEPIRDQVKEKYGNINCGNDIHPETWNRYPCELNTKTKCQNDHCDGKINFLVSIPTRDIKIITALFIRKERRGYALLNQALRNLFEEGILEKIETVDKELDMPIIPLPVKYYKNPPLPSHSFEKK